MWRSLQLVLVAVAIPEIQQFQIDVNDKQAAQATNTFEVLMTVHLWPDHEAKFVVQVICVGLFSW
jgi:hypothetical protein